MRVASSPPPSAERDAVPVLPQLSMDLPGSFPELLPEMGPVPGLGAEQSPGEVGSPFTAALLRIAGLLGLDRSVVFTLLARGWSSLAGIGTLSLIARSLSRAEQGFYYTFYSLVALQIVFELGFSVVILQTASHEAAHLAIAPDGRVTGEPRHHARLASVLQRAVRWYGVAAVAMVAVLLPAGWLFFSTTRGVGTGGVAWRGAWALVVVASALTFQVDPLFSFLEGCGRVAAVARVRLGQAVFGTLLGWAALLAHHGLLAPGLMIAGQAAVGFVYLGRSRLLLGPLLRHTAEAFPIDWRREIWPFQWRIAVSWICGFFISQLFNPVLFRYRGAVEAGQMGMSISVCGTLLAMAVAWINTKAAPFGRMIALRQFRELDRSFFAALRQSLAAACLAAAAAWSAAYALRLHHVPFALRLLPPGPLGLLLLTTIANILVFAEALYLRAHKQEKFMLNSILGALWMAPATFVLGQRFGAAGIAWGYFGGTLVVGVGLGTWTFRKYRRLWHA